MFLLRLSVPVRSARAPDGVGVELPPDFLLRVPFQVCLFREFDPVEAGIFE